MTGDDENSRPASENSMGRRKWETNPKESFEAVLAMQTPSPVNKIQGHRALSSAKSKAVSDSVLIYGASKTKQDIKPPRVKSAVRKGSREAEAEAKHALKMAEGRRARGSSATSDKRNIIDTKSATGRGKIPVPIPRGSAKSIRRSQEDVSSSLSQADDTSSDNIASDPLAVKHSMIIDSVMKKKNYNVEDGNTGDESMSREEGYESDENILNNNSEKRTPSAPPMESSEKKLKKDVNVNTTLPKHTGLEKSTTKFQSPKLVQPNAEKSIENSSPTKPVPTKHKKKRKSRLSPSKRESTIYATPITQHLMKLEEDIIDSQDLNNQKNCRLFSSLPRPEFVALPGLIVANAHTQLSNENGEKHRVPNISTIYCDKVHGFVLSNDGKKYVQQKTKYFQGGEERLQQPQASSSRASLAVTLQTSFRTFSVCCQGLLAGISLAHCLMIFLTGDTWDSVTEAIAPRITHVFNALILFLSTVCFVAACDRCDLCSSKGGLLTHNSIHIPWSAGLYLASLSVTVATARTELLLAHQTAQLPRPHAAGGIAWYAWLCLTRTITNTLAWAAVVPDPHTDALLCKLHYLLQKEKDSADVRTEVA